MASHEGDETIQGDTELSRDELTLHDFEPGREQFLEEALRGLEQPRKELPCKYLYDEGGSRLFERICQLDEYYPTRTEISIMEQHAGDMAHALGPSCLLIEYGSGSSAKTRMLLAHLEQPAAYVPVDISREHLLASAASLARQSPTLEVLPVCADFTLKFEPPAPARTAGRVAVYFPGSTIGNFEKARAQELLRGIRSLCGSGGGLLIGADLIKDRAILERAYDDSEGVTAAFNLNLLARMNRELGSDFDVERFSHRAVWNEDHSRVEMHLVSEIEQKVRVDGRAFSFSAGETICTEHSHKYDLEGFASLADAAGFEVLQVWTDQERLFSVQYLRAR
jgi:dimethylhistidine N-methyltransferase